jgi:TRAP-type C4-dicarboxylate transport system substrate-binding protein
MKKALCLTLATAMMAMSLAACGGSSQSSSTTTAAAGSSEGAASDTSGTASESTAATDFSSLDPDAAKEAAAKIDYSKAEVVKFGNSGAVGEPAYNACEYFTNLVDVASNGKYRFDFYPSEQLGNETTMMENLQSGLQEGMMSSLDSLASYSKDLNILSMAFAFKSSDEMLNFLGSDIANQLWTDLDDNGFHVIAYGFEKNPRGFFGKKPLKSPADMKGMKYRIPQLPIFEKNALAMGAVPVVVSWSEYAYALKQGTVDGGECSKDSYRSAGLYESAPYFSEVDYAYPVECIYFSNDWWNNLSEEDQQMITDCAKQAQDVYNQQIKQTWEEDKKWLETEGGVTFVDFDKDAFMAAAANLGAELQSEDFFATKDLYDQVVKLNEEFEASH